MKLKKGLILIIITSIILISIPEEVFDWVTKDTTYEACNMINVCMSGTMKIVAIVITIIYITKAIKYMRFSKEEPKQKIKNIQTSLIITIIQIVILLFGASWVINVGMETYTIGKKYQLLNIDTLIPNIIRIISFVSIVFYIIKAIIYFINSEEENELKIRNLIKWQVITIIIVVTSLLLAKNW